MVKNKSGFTLIELLVVIAIIGLLSSMSVYAINIARLKARDTQRLSDLRQIQKALNLYYDDNGHYPVIRWATSGVTSYDNGTKWTSFINALAPYMKDVPRDPLSLGNSGPWYTNNFHYAYGSSDGQIYDLVGQLEDRNSQFNCEHKCSQYHRGENSYPPGSPWCGASTSCSGSSPWSKYMFSDH
jgi:general secretion pathway protein G